MGEPYTVNTAADRDTDNVGFSDLTEAAFGTNPNADTSRPAVTVTRNPTGTLTFRWPTATPVTGHTYTLESSPDLTTGTWSPVASASGMTTSTVTITPAAAGQRYYRIRAE